MMAGVIADFFQFRCSLVQLINNLEICLHFFDINTGKTVLKLGGGQPNLTQFMPIPHSNLKIGIGINWVKSARTGFF